MEPNLKISFAICTHNEGEYIAQLLKQLCTWIEIDIHRGVTYEIVVLDDYSNDPFTVDCLLKYSRSNKIKLYYNKLDKNYALHKNILNQHCTGDWILNLDADEYVTDQFLEMLPDIIDANPELDAYALPRINTVDGLTLKHLQRWNWTISKLENHRRIKVLDSSSDEYKLLRGFDMVIAEEDGIVTYYEPLVAWPDYQMRLYRNNDLIKWDKPVHEQLTGYKNFSLLPADEQFAIRHYKEIARQEIQNNFYDEIQNKP